jgi:hypothetical protein
MYMYNLLNKHIYASDKQQIAYSSRTVVILNNWGNGDVWIVDFSGNESLTFKTLKKSLMKGVGYKIRFCSEPPSMTARMLYPPLDVLACHHTDIRKRRLFGITVTVR